MKRFDRAIKVLTDELHREAGKVVTYYASRGIAPDLAVKAVKVKNLQRAIKILLEHPENKNF